MRKALLVVSLIVFVVLLSSSIVLAADVVVQAVKPNVVAPNSQFKVEISLSNDKNVCGFQIPVTFYHNTNNDVRCDSIQWTSEFLKTKPTMLAGQNGDTTYLYNGSDIMDVLVWAIWFDGIGWPPADKARPICNLYFTTGAKFDPNVGFHLDITSDLNPPGPALMCDKNGNTIPLVFKVNAGGDNEDVGGGKVLPTKFELYQNYPNPFNPSTTIEFDLPNAGNANATVYNVLGQRVNTLIDGNMPAGKVSVRWNGTDNNNNKVASGVYFVKVIAPGGDTRTIKISMTK